MQERRKEGRNRNKGMKTKEGKKGERKGEKRKEGWT